MKMITGRNIFVSVALLLRLILSLPASAQGVGGKGGIGGRSGVGGGVSSFTPLAFVQDVSAIGGGGAIASTSNNTAGNTLCFGISFVVSTGTSSVTSVTSSAGNTYTAASSFQSVADTGGSWGTLYAQWWCAFGIAGGVKDSVNAALSGSGAFAGKELVEIGPNGVLDQSTGASGTGTSISAGSITTPSSGAFALNLMLMDNGTGQGTWFTAGSGWTIASLNGGGGSLEAGVEYQAQSTAGSITGNATALFGAINWVSSMITIRTH